MVASGVVGGDAEPFDSASVACAVVAVVAGVDARMNVAVAIELVLVGVSRGSEGAVVAGPGVVLVSAAVVAVAAADRSKRHTESIQYCSHAGKGAPPLSVGH